MVFILRRYKGCLVGLCNGVLFSLIKQTKKAKVVKNDLLYPLRAQPSDILSIDCGKCLEAKPSLHSEKFP